MVTLRNGAPFTDLPEPLAHLRRALLHIQGGDRLMADVLALVPKAALEAVELMLEHATSSGQISVEHILNVLTRLKDLQRPAPVATHRM